ELVQAFPESAVALEAREFAPVIVECAREICPDIVINSLAGIFSRCFLKLSSKYFIRLISAGKTDESKSRGKSTVGSQVVESRYKFSVGQISGSAKDHHRTRLCHSAICEPLQQWINRQFVGHNIRLVTRAATRT